MSRSQFILFLQLVALLAALAGLYLYCSGVGR